MKYFLLTLATFFLLAGPAHAARGRIGVDDKFHTVAPLEIPREKVLALGLPPEWASNARLAKHVQSYWLFAGVYAVDKGYVITTGRDAYWSLSDSQIAILQGAGALPTPLPRSPVPWMDYLLGFSLWIIIVGFVAYSVVRHRLEKRRGVKMQALVGASFAELLRNVLSAMVRKDGPIDPRDAALIADIVGKTSGEPQNLDAVRAFADACELERNNVAEFLEVNAESLSPEQRRLFVVALCRMCAADGDLESKERAFLKACVVAIGYHEKEAPALIDQAMATAVAA